MSVQVRCGVPGECGTLLVPLTQGLVTVVDAELFESVLTLVIDAEITLSIRPSSRNWHAFKGRPYKGRSHCYVACGIRVGPRRNVMLHRLLTSCPLDLCVDHRDGNTLNNVRSNLRVCTPSENRMNSRGFSTSGLKGVRKKYRRYNATIWHSGKSHHIGAFATKEEAARAYDDAAVRFFGDFARLNYQQGSNS